MTGNATPDRATIREIVKAAWIDAYNEGGGDPDDYIEAIVDAICTEVILHA